MGWDTPQVLVPPSLLLPMAVGVLVGSRVGMKAARQHAGRGDVPRPALPHLIGPSDSLPPAPPAPPAAACVVVVVDGAVAQDLLRGAYDVEAAEVALRRRRVPTSRRSDSGIPMVFDCRAVP